MTYYVGSFLGQAKCGIWCVARMTSETGSICRKGTESLSSVREGSDKHVQRDLLVELSMLPDRMV